MNSTMSHEDDRTLEELPLIHLHGDVNRPIRGYVFSRDEYIRQITMINPWMTVLSLNSLKRVFLS